jgi:hypothetical protein
MLPSAGLSSRRYLVYGVAADTCRTALHGARESPSVPVEGVWHPPRWTMPQDHPASSWAPELLARSCRKPVRHGIPEEQAVTAWSVLPIVARTVGEDSDPADFEEFAGESVERVAASHSKCSVLEPDVPVMDNRSLAKIFPVARGKRTDGWRAGDVTRGF